MTRRKCESVAKSIVLIVFYPNNMVPLWCMDEINSRILGKPPQLFSITHNDAGIPLQNRWIEKHGKKRSQERENYHRKKGLDKDLEIGSENSKDCPVWEMFK